MIVYFANGYLLLFVMGGFLIQNALTLQLVKLLVFGKKFTSF